MNRNPPKALIVDDQKIYLQTIGAILKSSGFDIRFALSAKKLLKKIDSCKPDIIILDVHLKDENGISICNVITTNPHTKDIPVLIVSSDHAKSVKQEAFEAGCMEYLDKPIDNNKLLYAANVGVKLYRMHELTNRLTNICNTKL